MGDRQITPGEWIIMGAGVVMLLASFLDFAFKTSAWGRGLFPIATLMTIYGVLMAAQIAMVKFAGASMPDRIAGFTWEQIHLVLGFFATLMAVSWLITDDGSKSIGFWLLFLGSIALLVGAVLLQRERRSGAF